MNRLRFLLLTAVCVIAPALPVRAAPVQGGGRSGLEQVPASAPLVMHVRGVQGIHDRLTALMKQALPDVLDKYKDQIDDFFKKGPENVLKSRKLSGLAKDGPFFFALLELPKPGDSGEPKMAFILTVTDYKKFLDDLLTEEENKNAKDEGNSIKSVNFENSGKTTYFVDRKGYAIVTPDKDVAESFISSKKITGLDTKMNKELAAKLLASDLGVYVNMADVNKEYDQFIKQARQGIEQLLAFGAGGADESAKKFTEMTKTALPHIFQTIEDLQSLLLTFELRPGGLALHLQGEVKESSPTATLMQDSRPVDFEELGRLPRDRALYLGMNGQGFYKFLAGALSNLPGGGTKDLADQMAEIAKAGPSVKLFTLSFPLAALDVSHFGNPAKAVAATLKTYEKMDLEANKLKKKPEIKKDAEKFGDFKLHSVQLEEDFDKMVEDIKAGEDAKKQLAAHMKSLLGDKRTVWFGTDGKTMVTVTAPDWKTASKLLEQYSKDAGTVREVKAFTDARKEMPKQTSFLVLVDIVPMLGKILDVAKPLLPAVQAQPNWPKMPGKGTSGFAGLALTLQPTRGGLDLFISLAAVREFYKAVIQPLGGE